MTDSEFSRLLDLAIAQPETPAGKWAKFTLYQVYRLAKMGKVPEDPQCAFESNIPTIVEL